MNHDPASPHRPTARRTAPVRGAQRHTALVSVVLATAVLAGCSGSGGDSSSGSSAAGGAAQAATAVPGAAESQAHGVAAVRTGGDATTGSTTVDRRIVRTAEITVQVAQLAPAAARVRQAATDLGGFVAGETTGYSEAVTSTGSSGTGTSSAPDSSAGSSPERTAQAGQSVLVLRVPQAKLDQALGRATAVGTELSRTSSAQDVTGDLADLASRTATQRAGLARVRALLADATKLSDVVTLESELTRRESDLEALEARLATLGDQADLATLTVVLQTPAVQGSDDDNALVAGLKKGWHALVSSFTGLIVAVAAILPFVLLFALIGVPLWWLRRRRRTVAPAGPVATAPDQS